LKFEGRKKESLIWGQGSGVKASALNKVEKMVLGKVSPNYLGLKI
jgi:hypothetical protein